MTHFENIETWAPSEDLMYRHRKLTYAVLVLNSTKHYIMDRDLLINLWNNATVRISMDDGTEQWHEWLNVNNVHTIVNPDIKIFVTRDHNETDYTRALRELDMHCNIENIEDLKTIYVLVDTSSRLDKIMADINTLYKAREIFDDVKIYHIGATSITWLLCKGSHSIDIPMDLRNSSGWCSLLPIGGPCFIKTTGLKWNIDNKKLEFGALISSSNAYDGSQIVTVQTDNPVVWSMGLSPTQGELGHDTRNQWSREGKGKVFMYT